MFTFSYSYNSRFQSWRDKPRYTLDYAPPELLTDLNVVTYSPAVDIYGLGATLYTMLVGHAPYRQYEGDCDHTPEAHHKVRRRIHSESFNQSSKRWLSASTEFRELVTWCLQRDPADRPQLSEIFESEWLRENIDQDIDFVPPPEQILVDLSEDTMEQPFELSIKQENQKQLLMAMQQKSTAEVGGGDYAEEPTTNEDITQCVYDPDFDALIEFHGFDELAPPLRLPSEYYTELPLQTLQDCNVTSQLETAAATAMPPVAPAPKELPVAASRGPLTRQQRRNELGEKAGSPSAGEDSKADLYLLLQQLPPVAEVEPVVSEVKPRATPTINRQSPRPLNDLYGFGKTKATWRKSRASWRHFCLLLNGVQQVLKHRFKKERRVYCSLTIKAEAQDEAYEKPLIFPRPRPPALRRAKRPPKVPRPPTRVQPERARALRQRYVFE